MDLQSIDLQPYVPTFVIALGVALGLAIVLIGLLWLVGRLIPVPRKRLWRVVRMLFVFPLRVLLVVGAVLLILRFIGVDVAWLALMFMGMFWIGSLLSRWNSARQLWPDVLDLPVQPAVQDPVAAVGVMPPVAPAAPAPVMTEGVMPAAATPSPVVSTALAADTVAPAEAIPGDSQAPATPSGDMSPPAPVSATEPGSGSPAMLATTPESDATPDSMLVETGGQDAVLANLLPNTDDHLDAPIQRPWQQHEPVPLTRRSVLGKSTIRAMRTNK